MVRQRMDTSDEIAEVLGILEDANGRLLEISMSLLSNAVEAGETTRPAGEKAVTQARRAVERAIGVLRSLSND